MIFRRYYTIQSKKNAEELKAEIVGKHFKVHELDFEVIDRDGEVKIIPHAENDDHVYTLPITRVRIKNNNNGSTVRLLSKPRRIDIGGPYLIMIFVTLAIGAGIMLYLFGEGVYNNTAYIFAGLGIFIFIILWMRMEQGYFDYIRKIKKWCKENI